MKALFEIFSPVVTAQCRLSCQIGLDHFVFTISDETGKRQQGIGVYEVEQKEDAINEIEQFLKSNEWLQKDYLATQIFYTNKDLVFVPFSVFDRNKIDEVLNLIHGDLKPFDTVAQADILSDLSTYAVYRVAKKLHEILVSHFKNVTFGHLYSCYIRRPSLEQMLTVNFVGKKALLALAKDGKWQFVKELNFEGSQEVLYHLLNIASQYEIENIPLHIGGLIDKDSTLFMEIYKYFQDVRFSSLPESFQFHEDLVKYPAHYFTPYFQEACE